MPSDYHVAPELAERIVKFLIEAGDRHVTLREIGRRFNISLRPAAGARELYRWGQTVKLSLSKILRDERAQPRVAMDEKTVAEYAEKMERGTIFPPVTVYYDGTDYWLADGWHRVAAAERAGVRKLDCEVKQGTVREAILHSVGANAKHGLKRSNADKRRAIVLLLEDEEWGHWSNHQIANRTQTTAPLVADVRKTLVASGKVFQIDPVRTGTRNGKSYPINTANITSANIERKSNPGLPAASIDDEPKSAPEPTRKPTPEPGPEPKPEFEPEPELASEVIPESAVNEPSSPENFEALLYDFACDCRDNFDCDEDAHRHGTTCRKCRAGEILDGIEAMLAGQPADRLATALNGRGGA